MPKDADFNAGEGKGVEPVNARDNVLSTSGAINVLGNVWEWTSTSSQVRGHVGDYKAVKGGAWDSKRTECRTENREEGREASKTYANVGFRLVKE